MNRNVESLSEQTFDLVIIGGGILGAGIARDASMRGLSVALIEKNDFASGTSSASTKLIHGGLRYLKQFAFRLVAESCRERSVLLDMAPHLVNPLPLLMPVYSGDQDSLFRLRLGTTLYDWMTFPRHPLMPRHTTLTPSEAVALEPTLPMTGQHGGALQGAVVVYDCQMDDSRLCIETILDAERRGAVCINYCRATGLRMHGSRVDAVQAVDAITGNSLDVRARTYINAAGPWAEQICDWNKAAEGIRLSPTKGVHLVIPRVQKDHGLYFPSKTDGRMIFLVPWDDVSLIGTSDTDFSEDPGEARSEADDIAYLLGQLKSIMPDAGVTQSDIMASFAGVRALVRSDSRLPSSRSREEKIARQGDNLLNVAGGKYTTFRAVADKAIREVYRMNQQRPSACTTATTPLRDSRPPRSGVQLATSPEVYESDIVHACQLEKAVTLTDVMRRRTRLALSPHGGAQVAGNVSHLMAARCDWDDATRTKQVSDYLQERNRG